MQRGWARGVMRGGTFDDEVERWSYPSSGGPIIVAALGRELQKAKRSRQELKSASRSPGSGKAQKLKGDFSTGSPLVYCGLVLHLHLTGTRGCEGVILKPALFSRT